MYSENSIEKNIFAKLLSINYVLLILIIALFTIGIFALLSASNGDFNSWPIKHSQRFILSIILFFFVALIDIRIIFKFAYLIFFLSILSLVVIPFVGVESNGATRWINILGLSIQPCLLYTSPSPRDRQKSRMPSSA